MTVSDPPKRERATLAPKRPPAPHAGAGAIRIMAYSETAFEEGQVERVEELTEWLGSWPAVWVDLDPPFQPATLSFFKEHLGLHPLAVEDIHSGRQRPKVEAYGNHLFIILRMLKNQAGLLQSEQLAIFLGKGFLITFQHDMPGDCLDTVRERLRSGRGQARRNARLDHLAYEIIDGVIDHYFPICHAMDERLEVFEDEIVTHLPKDAPERVLGAKHDVLLLRRLLTPTRDLVMTLQRNDLGLFAPETLPYLRDCYDHANRLLDTVETQREVTSTLMDLYLSLAADRTNSVIRFLTLISTIFIPLTFIAGVYGMNFEHMPELKWRYGYAFSLGLMGALAAFLIAFFYWRGWIERPPPNRKQT